MQKTMKKQMLPERGEGCRCKGKTPKTFMYVCMYLHKSSYEMRRKIILVKTLNKTQEELKTVSKKQSTENELKMMGEERKKRKKFKEIHINHNVWKKYRKCYMKHIIIRKKKHI